MKPKVNIFGQKVCLLDDCPAYFTGEYGSACDAKLNHWGRIAASDDGVQMGMLCHLPVEFELIRSEDRPCPYHS